MNEAGFNSKYYRLMLDTLNTVYRDIGLGAQVGHVLGIIGEVMGVSRVYVFEDDFENRISRNTYEWCGDGVEAQIEELQEVPHSVMGAWHDMLREEGIIRANALSELPGDIYDQLVVQGILSIVVLPLYIDDKLYGYIGFDECNKYREWSDSEIETLRALSNLVVNLIARHNAEQKANTIQKTLRTVLDNIDTPIYATDPKTSRILFANRKIKEELGCGDVEGEICWKVMREGESDVCVYCPCKQLAEMEPGAALHWEVFNNIVGKWYYCTDRLIEWTDGRTAHLQAALDITSRKEYEEKLKFNASYDKMTGIYNRESGLTLLKDMIESGKREGKTLTLCYLDIDGLKYVNDRFGHVEGDRLIMAIAEAIRGVVRTTDVFARIGGDEFMLALRACPLKNAKTVMGKLNRRLEELSRSGEYPYELSVSAGLTEVTPETDWVIDDLLMEADRRMYENKQAKKGYREV